MPILRRATGAAGVADRRQVRERDRLGRGARIDRGARGFSRIAAASCAGVGLAGLRRQVDRAQHRAGEQLLRVSEHFRRREAGLHVAEHLQEQRRAADRLADVDRADDVVGHRRAGLDCGLLHLVGESDVELGHLAVDLGLRRRRGERFGDHAAHVLQRRLPVRRQRHERDQCAVRRAADVLVVDRGDEIIRVAARARFEPPVDHRRRDRVEQVAAVVFEVVDHLMVRPHVGVS